MYTFTRYIYCEYIRQKPKINRIPAHVLFNHKKNIIPTVTRLAWYSACQTPNSYDTSPGGFGEILRYPQIELVQVLV